MARLYTLGAEENDPVLYGAAVAGIPLLSNLYARTGQRSYRVSEGNYWTFPLDGNPTEVYFGGAFRLAIFHDTRPQLYIWTGTTQFQVLCKTNGVVSTLNPTQNSAAGVVSTGVWHYLEVWLKPLNSGGRMTLKIDGTTIFDFTGDTTGNAEYCTQFQLRGSGAAPNETYWDDVVVNDTSGSDNNTWPGQVRLLPIYTRAAGDNAQWGRAGIDYGNNFSQVRASLTDIEEYAVVQTDTLDNLDQYLVDVPDLPADATIKNVVAQIAARLESGTGNIRVGIEAGGTLSESADQALSNAWKYYSRVLSLNPGTAAAWTESDLSAVQMGVKAR